MIKSSVFTFLFLSVFLNTGKAQVFWMERFENNCTSKCKAEAYTDLNGGLWKVKAAIGEGLNANDWFVSCAVTGQPNSGCNSNGACYKPNSCLHLCSTNDVGADYTKGAAGTTDKRVESPTINCTGKSNIKIDFDFICRPDTLTHLDRCDFEYSPDDGANWFVVDSNLISDRCSITPDIAIWLKYSHSLPAGANNNATVKIGFHWKNKATTALNTGFAVDSIRLSTTAAGGITTGTIVGSPFCACSAVSVPYDATGTPFISGNSFIVELSDATGSFAKPDTIGLKITTADTGHISAFIPCTAKPGTAYRIRVKSTNPNITGADNGVNLIINAPIQVNATPNPDTICAGTVGVLKGTGGDPGNYLWYLPPSTIPVGTADTFSVSPLVNTTYIVFGKKGACVDTTAVKVVIQPRPVVNVTNDTTCVGLGAVLKATGGTKYLWGDGSTKDSIVIFPTKDTSCVVTITKGHCVVKDTGFVKVFNQITIAVNSPTICQGEVATLTATGALNYSWSNGMKGAQIKVSPTTNTSYTVTGTAGSCTDLAVANVTVNAKPDVKVATPAPVCEGQSVFLKATGATTYFWLVSTPNSNHDTITVKTPISRPYSVVGVSNGCIDTAIVFVTIDQRPNVAVNSPTICLGGTATLTADGAHHYLWEINGDTSRTISVSPTQDAIYKVYGYSENGSCTDTAYGYVTVGKPIPVTITGKTDLFSCESTLLSASPTDGTYSWGVVGDSDGKIDCETCVSTLVTPPRTLAYYVVYTTPAGCIGKDTILVTVTDINSYFLATGLTPNGDGINDVVQVHGRGIDHINFMIFDRVGEKVFETHEIESGWDGTLMGVPMNNNVFVYRLEIYYCNGENVKETGNITILR